MMEGVTKVSNASSGGNSSNIQQWNVKIQHLFQGAIVLEAELLNGGARLKLFHSSPLTYGSDGRRMVRLLTLQLCPPVAVRAGWMSTLPDRLFDLDADRKGILDGYLLAWLVDISQNDAALGGSLLLKNEEIASSLRDVQHHLVASLLHEPAKAAALFPAGGLLRWWIYEQAANDETGRIIQMASVCPGLLILARELERNGPRGASSLILDLIVQGCRRGEILEWASDFISGSDSRNGKNSRRLWISRAGTLIPPSLLLAIPVEELIPEDIPAEPRDNLVWYSAQKFAGQRAADYLPGRIRRGFLAFISRNAAVLERALKAAGFSFEQGIIQLCDYVRASDRCPNRSTRPDKLLEESSQWHERLADLQAENRMDPLLAGNVEIPPGQTLDPGPAANYSIWRWQGNLIRFLPIAGDLKEESSRMQHCVSTYASMAVQGKVQFFHGDIAGEQSTIEVSFRSGKPALLQKAGIPNAPLGAETERIIHIWFEDLYAALSAAEGGKLPRLTGKFEGA